MAHGVSPLLYVSENVHNKEENLFLKKKKKLTCYSSIFPLGKK